MRISIHGALDTVLTHLVDPPNIRRMKYPKISLIAPIFALFVLVGLSGCGTSHVRLMVVRPAVINAQPYGGVVTVGGIAPGHPNWHQAVGHLRMQLKQRILNSYGRVVKLSEFGGGLVIDGRLEDHGVRTQIERRRTTCSVRVNKREGNKTVTRTESRPCIKKSNRWRSRVSVVTRVTDKEGQVLFLQRVVDEATGETPERMGRAPAPNYASILHQARLRLAQKMANIVAPHQVRVTATLYDCPGAAEQVCAAAVADFAHSQYDRALAKYDRALQLLKAGPDNTPDNLAEVHYNKSLIFKYSRRFDQALGELNQALQLDPGNSTYTRELQAVQADRDRHHQLIDQGLGAPAPN